MSENKMQAAQAADQVRFLGIRGDVPRVLKAPDVVVQSSHIDGFCLAAVEGMAAGKPVVVSDIPGLADVVGDAGVKFPHGDAKALAACIEHLTRDDNCREAVASRCSARARDFDISRMADAYIDLYQSLTPAASK